MDYAIDGLQARIERGSERGSECVPVHVLDERIDTLRECSAQLIPVDAVQRILHGFDKGIDTLCQLLSCVLPVKVFDRRCDQQELCREVVAYGFAQQLPVDVPDQRIQRLRQLCAQVCPVDAGQYQIDGMQQSVDTGRERAADQIPVDVIHQTIEDPTECIYVLRDNAAHVIPFNQILDLCERLIDTLRDDRADTFIVAVGEHLFDLADEIHDAAFNRHLLEHVSGICSPAATSAATGSAAVAPGVREDFQLIESRELLFLLFDRLCRIACRACRVRHACRVVLLNCRSFHERPLSGQRRDEHSDVCNSIRQQIDQICNGRSHRRNNRSERRREAVFKPSESGLHRGDRLIYGWRYLREISESLSDRASQFAEQEIQRSDTESIFQDRHKSCFQSAVQRLIRFAQAEKRRCRLFRALRDLAQSGFDCCACKLRQMCECRLCRASESPD